MFHDENLLRYQGLLYAYLLTEGELVFHQIAEHSNRIFRAFEQKISNVKFIKYSFKVKFYFKFCPQKWSKIKHSLTTVRVVWMTALGGPFNFTSEVSF